MASLDIFTVFTMLMREFENHLKRADARIIRAEPLKAIRERNRLIWLVIKINAAIIAILCAACAIYQQF